MSDTYADQFCNWLLKEGYTHCFFVAGGNIMHLLNSARLKFTCVPVVHEVAAGIAAEYFNETSDGPRAFAMVTAGPGITNIITSIAGAWLESRELLVVAGQVKSSDLASSDLRQRGIQEINGVSIVSSITKASIQILEPLAKSRVLEVCKASKRERPGPVFIEFCLDAQGSPANIHLEDETLNLAVQKIAPRKDEVDRITSLISESKRPVLLLGGGTRRQEIALLQSDLQRLGIPIMTTWNATDRIDSSNPLYWGRPNTWGQRSANVLLQQADLIIAVGTRLGLQQTGFNWKGFAPLAKVIQIDIDPKELSKGHPEVDVPICADASEVLKSVCDLNRNSYREQWQEWIDFGKEVRVLLPYNEKANSHNLGFLNPYEFVEKLSSVLDKDDIVIPCSSGGAFTTVMQSFQQKIGQKVVTDKGLASMGYGLSGAIGASYANPNKRVILIEGDGGFAQNLQEIGTVTAGHLPLKIFIYDNGGYASIRMTQSNYFGGAYVGCDRETGLGLPNWINFFASYGLRTHTLKPEAPFDELVLTSLRDNEPSAFIVPIDPEQTYFPKITSRVLANGNMESNPLHLMSPDLVPEVATQVFKYLEV